MNKYLIIINRFAGGAGGCIRAFEKELFTYFFDHNLEFKLRYTKAPKHATRIAREFLNTTYNHYVVCGGDGTINEVINGLNGSGKVLIPIPIGTVNILAKEFSIPKTPTRALDKILAGEIVELSVGTCNDTKFFLMASVGFDSYVVEQVTPKWKRYRRFGYGWKFFKSLFTYHYPTFKIIANGNEYTGTFALASQCVLYGGFLKITPNARAEDGQLNVCILKKAGLRSLLKFLILVLLGQNYRNKDCEYFYTDSLSITGPEMVSQLDGECAMNVPLELNVSGEKVRVLVPLTSK